jgi:WXG100 family type VII secretion target
MTGFDVNLPAVAQAAADSDSVGLELHAALESLRVEAEAVLAGEWLGRAATSFEHCWRVWCADAGAVITALAELAESLRSTASAYASRDDAAHLQLQVAGS